MTQRDRPVLLFDGDCGFCTRSAGWLSRLGIDAEVIAWQFAEIEQYGIGAEQAMSAVQWVHLDGRVRQGHEAIAAALGEGGFALRILGKLMVLPGITRLIALAYRLVAKYRYRLPGGTPACAAPIRPGFELGATATDPRGQQVPEEQRWPVARTR